MLKDLKSIKDSNLKLEIDEKIKDIEISSENAIKSGIVLDADESLFPYYDVKKEPSSIISSNIRYSWFHQSNFIKAKIHLRKMKYLILLTTKQKDYLYL